MINRLVVKNFALISELELEFGDRLNILSGETGAGKSILIDCICYLPVADTISLCFVMAVKTAILKEFLQFLLL